MSHPIGGTVHGLLGDGTDKAVVHVSDDRNARVVEKLAYHSDVIISDPPEG